MAAWSFLAEHRHEAGYNANKSKEDMKTDDCEKHRDVDGISIPATIVVSCKSWFIMSGGIEPIFRASLPGILLETHIILETMALTSVPGVRQNSYEHTRTV
jgi:hypothetical protein